MSPAPSLRSLRPALVVLGCALRREHGSSVELGSEWAGALGRRVTAAAGEWERAHRSDAADVRPEVVIVSGGRSWDGIVEADAMAARLAQLGVPRTAIVRERASLDTRDNARFSAAVCSRRGIESVVLVTCAFHLARARLCFEREGLAVAREVSAGGLPGGWAAVKWTLAKERFLSALLSAR